MSDKNQRVILFDGVCGLCNAWVDFVLKQDSEGKFQFAPLQGKFASEFATMEANELSSIVYRVEGVNFKKSGAVLRILRDLGGIWSIAWIFWLIPFFVRDPFYSIFAMNRYRLFGKREKCRIPTVEQSQRFLD